MNSSNTSSKTKEQYVAEIGAAIQNQTAAMLIDALAAANVRIASLEAEVEKLKKDLSGQ